MIYRTKPQYDTGYMFLAVLDLGKVINPNTNHSILRPF